MKRSFCFWIIIPLLFSCQVVKRMDDQVYIQQRTGLKPLPRLDSLLIVTNGTSATQVIHDDFLPLFQEYLKNRGVHSETLHYSYTGKRVDEASFDNRQYQYTLWIYEQDKQGQLLTVDHYTPLAIKLTDNTNAHNIWIATSLVNNLVRKKFYRERFAGTLAMIFRANGLLD